MTALRQALPYLAVALIGVGLLLGRVLWSSQEEFDLGRDAFERGDRQAAVLHLGRAAHWYAPGSPFVAAALDELRQIGRQAEMEGQVELALSAYRAIRSSCLGTRSFYTPHRGRLNEANRRIAALMARQPPPPMDRGKTVAQRQEEHLALLERVEEPQPLWSAVACVSFVLWVVGAFGFILRALDPELRPRRRQALKWGSIVTGGLILWVIALLLA